MDIASRIGRAYLDQEILRQGTDFVPDIHPADDMFQVLGGDPGNRPECFRFYYYKSGYDALRSLENVLACAGRPLSSLASVLEFACGYGRVTRFLAREVPAGQLWCSDILTDAVDFVTDAFGVRGFPSAPDPADLVFERTYDLIFVASLFSHLPRPRFLGWLRRLHEGLTPNGLLVFSTHGASVLPQIKMHRSGFTFLRQSESPLLNRKEYGTAKVRLDVVESIAREAGVAYLYSLERELWMIQDLHVATREAVSGLESFGHAPTLMGRIDYCEMEGRRCKIGGWAADGEDGAPLEEVWISAPGVGEARANVGFEREDVARCIQRPDFVASGWNLEADLPEALPFPQILFAHGRFATRPPACFDMVVLDPKSTDPG